MSPSSLRLSQPAQQGKEVAREIFLEFVEPFFEEVFNKKWVGILKLFPYHHNSLNRFDYYKQHILLSRS